MLFKLKHVLHACTVLTESVTHPRDDSLNTLISPLGSFQ